MNAVWEKIKADITDRPAVSLLIVITIAAASALLTLAIVTLTNSAMPYEFPVLKAKLFHFFPEALQRYKNDLKRQDAYLRARRVQQFLKPLCTDVEVETIPSKALFREFIGGSEYTY